MASLAHPHATQGTVDFVRRLKQTLRDVNKALFQAHNALAKEKARADRSERVIQRNRDVLLRQQQQFQRDAAILQQGYEQQLQRLQKELQQKYEQQLQRLQKELHAKSTEVVKLHARLDEMLTQETKQSKAKTLNLSAAFRDVQTIAQAFANLMEEDRKDVLDALEQLPGMALSAVDLEQSVAELIASAEQQVRAYFDAMRRAYALNEPVAPAPVWDAVIHHLRETISSRPPAIPVDAMVLQPLQTFAMRHGFTSQEAYRHPAMHALMAFLRKVILSCYEMALSHPALTLGWSAGQHERDPSLLFRMTGSGTVYLPVAPFVVSNGQLLQKGQAILLP